MIAALLLAACIPATDYTPTPVVEWSQAAEGAETAIYRVIWRRVGDVEWRGMYDLPVWSEMVADYPVKIYPGITVGVPVQRILPASEQLVEIEYSVIAVGITGLEAEPSTSIVICMPALCPRTGPCS